MDRISTMPCFQPKMVSKFPPPPPGFFNPRYFPQVEEKEPLPPGISPPPPGLFPPPPPGIFFPGHFPHGHFPNNQQPGFLPPQQEMMVNKHHPVVCSSSSSSSSNHKKTISSIKNKKTTDAPMANLINNLIDIFPSIIISNDSQDVKFLSRDSFKNHAAQVYPFILFKFDNSNTISYYGLEKSDKFEDDKRERLYRLLKGTKLLDARTGNENVSWSKLDDVFKKLPVSVRKKKTTITTTASDKHREEHADTRLGYRFDNMFAVKRYFTFGERIVNPGEYHIIQTSEVPLLYNELKPEHYRNKRKISTSQNSNGYYTETYEGSFDPNDQQYYNTFVLNPNTIYKVPPNTIYMLITIQKTLFSIDRVEIVKFELMKIEDHLWQETDIYSPKAHKELQLEIPAPITSNKNVKRRKKILDNEKKWIYNDELNPPQIFTQQISEEPYFYFEQSQPQQQQQQLYLMSSSNSGSNYENNEIIIPQQQNVLISSSSFENNEIIVPSEDNGLIAPSEEDNGQIIPSDGLIAPSEDNGLIVPSENDVMWCKDNEQQQQQNVSMCSIDETSNENIEFLDFNIDDIPPPSVQQEKEYNDIMDDLNSLADNYSSGEINSSNNNSTTNIIDDNSSPQPPPEVTENCNKLFDDLNDFINSCYDDL